MRSVEELLAATAGPVRSSARELNLFCDFLGRRLHPSPSRPLPTIEEIAALFREFYRLSVPVRPQLKELLRTAGIALIRHSNTAEKESASEFNHDARQWELYLRFDAGMREAHAVLQQLFLILAREAEARISWWEDWLAAYSRYKRRQLADLFAYAVALPPKPFCDSAIACGLNPWSLSARFLTPPGACLFMLMRRLSLPCPYFQAELNLRPQTPLQTRLRFDAQTLCAEVWKKGMKRYRGAAQRPWAEMERLGRCFPRRGGSIEAGGALYQAVRECRPILEITSEPAGIALPAPVCLVARPNGTAQSRMFVQIVPAAFRGILMEEGM